jgi:hypothetical protein
MEFFYDANLLPATNGEKQIITVAAKGESRFSSGTNTLDKSSTFELTFTNPCVNFDDITMTPAA